MAASPTQTARAAAQATDVELRAAWQALRVPAWPSSFEETMHDPIRSRLVRMQAMRQLRSRAYREATPLGNTTYACTTTGQRRKPLPARYDMKRAAAGDRDDD
jgi:hypothetical protein